MITCLVSGRAKFQTQRIHLTTRSTVQSFSQKLFAHL